MKAGTDGALIVTGNPATLVCGGFDDLHYDFTTATVTGYVIPGASITVFPASAMHSVAIGPDKLAAYLATDQDTRIFLITGPLSGITGLQEDTTRNRARRQEPRSAAAGLRAGYGGGSARRGGGTRPGWLTGRGAVDDQPPAGLGYVADLAFELEQGPVSG